MGRKSVAMEEKYESALKAGAALEAIKGEKYWPN